MAAKKPTRTSLPLRWIHNHGTYYYQVPKKLRAQWDNKTWYPLGKSLLAAHRTWNSKLSLSSNAISTLNQAADRYVVEILPKLAKNTQIQYVAAIARLRPVFGHMRLIDIEPVQVYKYLDYRPDTAGNREKAVLSTILSYCVRWGSLAHNPIKNQVKRNPETPRKRYVEDYEVDAFKRHCSAFLKAYVDLKCMLGVRQAIMLDLQLSMWDGKILKTPEHKGGKPVNFSGEPLAATIQACLDTRKNYKTRSLYILPTRQGTKYKSFGSIWQPAMKAYMNAGGQHFTEHDLRRKVGSDAETLEKAQQQLGHQNSSTTNRSYRVKPNEIIILDTKRNK